MITRATTALKTLKTLKTDKRNIGLIENKYILTCFNV